MYTRCAALRFSVLVRTDAQSRPSTTMVLMTASTLRCSQRSAARNWSWLRSPRKERESRQREMFSSCLTWYSSMGYGKGMCNGEGM